MFEFSRQNSKLVLILKVFFGAKHDIFGKAFNFETRDTLGWTQHSKACINGFQEVVKSMLYYQEPKNQFECHDVHGMTTFTCIT